MVDRLGVRLGVCVCVCVCVCVGFTTKKHMEIWEDDGIILYLVWGDGYAIDHICLSNFAKMSIKRVIFHVFKLFLYFFVGRKVSKVDGLNP